MHSSTKPRGAATRLEVFIGVLIVLAVFGLGLYMAAIIVLGKLGPSNTQNTAAATAPLFQVEMIPASDGSNDRVLGELGFVRIIQPPEGVTIEGLPPPGLYYCPGKKINTPLQIHEYAVESKFVFSTDTTPAIPSKTYKLTNDMVKAANQHDLLRVTNLGMPDYQMVKDEFLGYPNGK
jgi:hypothetical protein